MLDSIGMLALKILASATIQYLSLHYASLCELTCLPASIASKDLAVIQASAA